MDDPSDRNIFVLMLAMVFYQRKTKIEKEEEGSRLSSNLGQALDGQRKR